MGSYKNVMELLVEEEVARQYKALPARMASYVNPVELVAYALNQLPSLYATTEQGLNHQIKRGKERYGAQIAKAVQRALAAISRDPLRSFTPLQDQQAMPLREVLHQMRLLLRNDKVSWENLPTAVEQALASASQGGGAWEATYNTASAGSQFRTRRVSSYTAYASVPTEPRASINRKPQSPPKDDAIERFSWDDPLYQSR